MITDSAIDIDAPATLVWDVFSDVERWPEWTASVTSLKALDGPGLAVGKRFEIKQPRLPKLVWEVTALDEGIVVDVGAALARRPNHRCPRGAPRRRAHAGPAAARPAGPVGSLVARMMRGTTKRYLELEAQGLKARSEQLRGSTS